VARLVGTADTPEQRIAAAVLAAGKGAMASHRSAARLWGVPSVCDLGAVDPETVPAAVGHVVTTGLAPPAALRKAVDVHARRGRHGVPAFRDALDEWVIEGKPVDSVLEPAMRRLREANRLPPMEFHAVICGYEVDFWIERDRIRDAHLTTAGYITVRFTHRQLTQRHVQTADRIRGVVQRWAPQLLAPPR
jgi:hypothetical protein